MFSCKDMDTHLITHLFSIIICRNTYCLRAKERENGNKEYFRYISRPDLERDTDGIVNGPLSVNTILE